VLTVSDDELAVRDDDDALLEVAKGGHVWEGSGNSRGWTSRQSGRPVPGFRGNLGSLRHCECQYIS
jgi:hypothetical protein